MVGRVLEALYMAAHTEVISANNHRAMKLLRDVEVKLHLFLTPTDVSGQRARGTDWTGN
jgi:hypothetical protein